MNGFRNSAMILVTVVFVIAGGAASSVSALVIHRNFVGGVAPTNVAGGGDLMSIFDAAADLWQVAIHDPHEVSIDVRWFPLTSNTLAFAIPHNAPPTSSGRIHFDNDETTSWYLDPTPYDNTEYLFDRESFANLGGGMVNTGRVFSNAVGDAVGRYDLFTLALHEIGHILGVINFVGALLPDPLVIGPLLPFAGTHIDMDGSHISRQSHPDALMVPLFSTGRRILPSDIDILAAAQSSGFTDVTLNPQFTSVNEPSSLMALGGGLVLFVLLAGRLNRAGVSGARLV